MEAKRERRCECFSLLGANVLLAAVVTGSVGGQVTERVSVGSHGVEGNGASLHPSVSVDGHYVAFQSFSSNLVSGDSNGDYDIFLYDRHSGVTQRVSVSSLGAEGNDWSEHPSISADGRYVAFESLASNLITGDTNGFRDVFVHDRQSGMTERVSVGSTAMQGNLYSRLPSISGDGRYIAFESEATNLVSGDTNGQSDVFVHDRQSATTERISVDSVEMQGNERSFKPSISGDGRYVAFESLASNLVSGDTTEDYDVFVRDRQSGITERVSVDSMGMQGNSDSAGSSISADGRYVAFSSHAQNLVTGDSNGFTDVFVHDRQTGATARVSVDSLGAQANNFSYYTSSVSADGGYVAFESDASNLVSGDTNGLRDAFVHNYQSGMTERVSVDSFGTQGNGTSSRLSVSALGLYVAFMSLASNLVSGDTNGFYDVFVRRRGPAPMVASLGYNCAAPYLTWSGSPSLGGEYTVMTVNLGTDNQVLFVDWSHLDGVPRRLKFGVRCQLWLSSDFAYVRGNTPDYIFSIPNDATLLGVHLRTQAEVMSAPPATTQVLDALIGLR